MALGADQPLEGSEPGFDPAWFELTPGLAGCDPFEARPLGLQFAGQHLGLIRGTHHHLGLAEGIEQLQLRGQALLIGAMAHRDHHLPFGGGLEGVEGPEQGTGLHDQDPVVALPRGPAPQALTQLIEPLPFTGQLPHTLDAQATAAALAVVAAQTLRMGNDGIETQAHQQVLQLLKELVK